MVELVDVYVYRSGVADVADKQLQGKELGLADDDSDSAWEATPRIVPEIACGEALEEALRAIWRGTSR